MPLLTAAKNPRVINVASYGHNFAKMDFNDINFDRPSNWFVTKWTAYGNSKLANILHA